MTDNISRLRITASEQLALEAGAFVATPDEITLANDDAAQLLRGQYGPYEPTPASLQAMLDATRLEPGRRITFSASNVSVTYECEDCDVALSRWKRVSGGI